MQSIINISRRDLETGNHMCFSGKNMLIQISDPALEFVTPAKSFDIVARFEFLDLEEKDGWGDEFKITDDQAGQIVDLLQYAMKHNMHVTSACVAGVCRSGAVCEVGVMMGFRDRNQFRSPNLMVKHKMMKYLGWTYDSDEPFSENGRHYFYDCQNNKVFYDEIESGGEYGG